MQNNQKVILCASDIHLNFENVSALIQREVGQKIDYIFLLGDFLNLQHTKEEESEIDNLKKLIEPFRSLKCPIYLIPGNHDSDELLKNQLELEGFTNIHMKTQKLNDEVFIVGIGGSIPGFQNNSLVWQGYPYENDEQFSKDLQQLDIPKDGKVLLLSHIGPTLSHTTVSYEHGLDQPIISGSESLSTLIRNNINIIANIHGHTHDGVGSRRVHHCEVINVGPLLYGNYCKITISNKLDKIEHIFI